jgi:hypothetical protein
MHIIEEYLLLTTNGFEEVLHFIAEHLPDNAYRILECEGGQFAVDETVLQSDHLGLLLEILPLVTIDDRFRGDLLYV